MTAMLAEQQMICQRIMELMKVVITLFQQNLKELIFQQLIYQTYRIVVGKSGWNNLDLS